MDNKVYAVRCTDYARADEKLGLLLDMMGGMGRFAGKGETLALKANLLESIAPDRAVNYHCDSEGTRLNYEVVGQAAAAVREGVSPEGDEGKEITALHRRWLTITGKQYDAAKHRGIAELYVMDERFTAYYDKQVPGCARFLRDAVAHWAK